MEGQTGGDQAGQAHCDVLLLGRQRPPKGDHRQQRHHHRQVPAGGQEPAVGLLSHVSIHLKEAEIGVDDLFLCVLGLWLDREWFIAKPFSCPIIYPILSTIPLNYHTNNALSIYSSTVSRARALTIWVGINVYYDISYSSLVCVLGCASV